MGASHQPDRRRRPRQLALLGVLAAALLVFTAPASAQSGTRCAEVFPGAEWSSVPGAEIDLGVSGLPLGQVPRFRDDVRFTAGAVADDIGGLEQVAVCIIGPDSAADTSAYSSGVRRFHAAVDGPQRLVVVSSANPANVRPAVAFGLPHAALWVQSGDEGWPEPLATTIGQWYRALALDRMDQYRVESTGADFSVDALTGESSFGLDFSTDPRVDWAAGSQEPVLRWDPETNEQSIGYFIEWTTEREGTEILLETDPAAWTEREAAWRVSLLEDLTGRSTPTTGWMIGVGIAVVAVVVATTIAVHGFLEKRRRTRTRGTPART